MSRKFIGTVIVMTLSLAVSLVHAEPRRGGGGGERSGGERSDGERSGGQSRTGKKPPGGSWSEYNHQGTQSNERTGNAQNESHAKGAAADKSKNSQPSGAEDAAAGAARSNRNSPQASGAEGAAAGAAAANRNAPKASGAQGAAAGAATANRNNPQYSGAQGAAVATGYAGVRNNVDHRGLYGQQWHGDHPSAWSAPGWVEGAAWVPETWESVAGHCGYTNITPVRFDYGSNVTCTGGNVIINGQSVGTAEDFSHEADAIAEAGTNAATAATDNWMPLGVFALVRNEHQHPQLIMQLAINQQGILRGNYTDEVTDSTLPIHGEVDLQSRRAAWTVGDNRFSVIEAGLKNLTESEAPALIHKNGTTQRWLLVRLTQSSQNGNDAAQAEATK